MLGFTSFYREGVEMVLFLQGYRLRLGGQPVLDGVLIGLLLTAAVGALTFIAHRKLPYKRMLVVTGVLLGAVLLVMVGAGPGDAIGRLAAHNRVAIPGTFDTGLDKALVLDLS